MRRSTLHGSTRSSRIDSILENGCISRCSLDERTGALRLYVRINARCSSVSTSPQVRYKRRCEKSKLHIGYREKIRVKKRPCPKTQIVKEQNVQTEITISVDADMWETREYCRCDLRDGWSESTEPSPPPPHSPPPQRESTPESYDSYQTPPPKIASSQPKKREKVRRGSKLGFRNYNIAFQNITVNSELPKGMKRYQNYYVTQDPHYTLKFEESNRLPKNEMRRMDDITKRGSQDGKDYDYQPRERVMKGYNGSKRGNYRTPHCEENPEFKLDDDRLYQAWKAFRESFFRYLAEDKIPARRAEDRLKSNTYEVFDEKEGNNKPQKEKRGRRCLFGRKKKFIKENEEKKQVVETKIIKKGMDTTVGKKRGAGDIAHRLLGFGY